MMRTGVVSETFRGVPPSDHLSLRVGQVCESVGAFIEYWGFKAIHGRIWTLLALSTEPLTQIEVSEFLDVSRSLVSGAMAELLQRGLVQPSDERRQAPYRAVFDIWPTVSDVLREREWMLVETVRVALEGALDAASMASEKPPRFSVERMRFLYRMTELAQGFLRILLSLRVPRKLDGLGGWLKDTAKLMQGLGRL